MTWDQLPDSRKHVLDDKVWKCLCYDHGLLCFGTLTLFIKKIAINLENDPSWVGVWNIIASRLVRCILDKVLSLVHILFLSPRYFSIICFYQVFWIEKVWFPQESFYVFELLSIGLYSFCCFKFSSIEWIGWGLINSTNKQVLFSNISKSLTHLWLFFLAFQFWPNSIK